MPVYGLGAESQIGFGSEVTYGTRVVPTRFLDYRSESLKGNPGVYESKSLRAGGRVLNKSARSVGVKPNGSGSIEFDLRDAGFGMLLRFLLGGLAQTQPNAGTDPTVYDYTGTLDTALGKSLTVQKGVPNIDEPTPTVDPYDFVGGKVIGWKVSAEAGGEVALTLDFDFAKDPLTDQSLAVASYPAGYKVLSTAGEGGTSLTINGTEYPWGAFTLSGDLGLLTDRYRGGGSGKKEPRAGKAATFTLSIDGDYVDNTMYGIEKAGTFVPVVIDIKGDLISHGGATYYYKGIKFTMPAMSVDGEPPAVGGPDLVPQPLALTAWDDTGGDAISFVYRTTDTNE